MIGSKRYLCVSNLFFLVKYAPLSPFIVQDIVSIFPYPFHYSSKPLPSNCE
jgi:hypothetical protein